MTSTKFILAIFESMHKRFLNFSEIFGFKQHDNLLTVLDGVKNVAVIGRGSSINESNPWSLIEKTDFKIIMNRVDLESLPQMRGYKIDAQIAQPPPPYSVLPPSLIEKYAVDYVSSNKTQKNKQFYKFKRCYQKCAAEILRFPDDSELGYPFTRSTTYAPTQCGSILRVLFNVCSVERIVFAGVDFFMDGYWNKSEINEECAPRIVPSVNFEKKGKPLAKWINDSVKVVSLDRDIELYFPEKTRILFGDSCCESIKFY